MTKLWGGRFNSNQNQFAENFAASIHFDWRLAEFDIQGSIAHAKMLTDCKIIEQDEGQKIVDGLRVLYKDLLDNKLEFSTDDEDIHLNIERLLTQKIGPVAGKLHTARSRNDQVALDLHLFVRAEVVELGKQLIEMQKTLVDLAATNISIIMPGYTHLQRAQPLLFSQHLLAYAQMFQRDLDRLSGIWKQVNISPLGAGALAGTTFPIDRKITAQLLKFDDIYENSMDAVSNRDFILDFLSTASISMMHLSRLCEEIILWSSAEFGFIELDDRYSTGSSIMPQKKNADYAELIRGKTGRVYGASIALLTTMKGLPLTYNKDMQEDKEGLFDASYTLKVSLKIVADMLSTMQVNQARMRDAAQESYVNATDAADYLAKKGIPFREAHYIVGQLVKYCIKVEKKIEELPLAKLKEFSGHFEHDIFEVLAIENVVDRRVSEGGTARSVVSKQIQINQERIICSISQYQQFAERIEQVKLVL